MSVINFSQTGSLRFFGIKDQNYPKFWDHGSQNMDKNWDHYVIQYLFTTNNFFNSGKKQKTSKTCSLAEDPVATVIRRVIYEIIMEEFISAITWQHPHNETDITLITPLCKQKLLIVRNHYPK